jgi:hypothetical protein
LRRAIRASTDPGDATAVGRHHRRRPHAAACGHGPVESREIRNSACTRQAAELPRAKQQKRHGDRCGPSPGTKARDGRSTAGGSTWGAIRSRSVGLMPCSSAQTRSAGGLKSVRRRLLKQRATNRRERRGDVRTMGRNVWCRFVQDRVQRVDRVLAARMPAGP